MVQIDGLITLASDSSSATILPRSGGKIKRLTLDGSEILFADGLDTLVSPRKVRGGIPLMFPNAGSLDGGVCNQLNSRLPHHGFAMVKEWSVVETSNMEAVLSLDHDEQTMECYPVRFALEERYLLSAKGLRIELTMRNLDEVPMPVAPGWHPYFACPAKGKTSLETSLGDEVSSQLDNRRQFDFGVVPPASSDIEFTPPNGRKVRMTFSPEFRHLQFWSEVNRDFICIEPFLGLPNTMNTDGCMVIPPGESRMLWMSIEAIS